MKKIFSLFAAVLFAGSIFAAEIKIYENTGSIGTDTYGVTATGNINTTASNGNSAPAFGNTSEGNKTFTFAGFALSAYSNKRLALDAKFSSFPSTTNTWPYLEVKFYKNGTLVQTDNTTVSWASKNNTYSNYSISITNDFDSISMVAYPAIGQTGAGKDATNYALYFDNVTIYGESSDPVISADDIDLGILYIDPAQSQLEDYEITFDVTSDNITEDSISVSLPAVTNLEIVNPSTGELTPNTTTPVLLHLTAGEGVIDEQVVFTAGSTTKTVAITGEIQVRLYNPGTGITNAEFVTPAATDTAYLVNTSDVPYTVNGQNAIKVGTSSKLGVAKVKVPANANKLYVMAAAWAQKAARITVTGPTGVTISSDSINAQGKVYVYADAGLTGDGPAFNTTGADQALYQYEFDLSGLTGETTIEFASTSRTYARFFIWNATYATTPTALDDTAVEGKAVKELRAGQVVIIKGEKTYNVLGQEIR